MCDVFIWRFETLFLSVFSVSFLEEKDITEAILGLLGNE